MNELIRTALSQGDAELLAAVISIGLFIAALMLGIVLSILEDQRRRRQRPVRRARHHRPDRSG